MDKATVGGLAVGFGGITAGLLLEGGKLSQILQPTAALIVPEEPSAPFCFSLPLSTVLAAVRGVSASSSSSRHPAPATKSAASPRSLKRRAAMASSRSTLELPNIDDPFMRRALMLAVDGTESSELPRHHAVRTRLQRRSRRRVAARS